MNYVTTQNFVYQGVAGSAISLIELCMDALRTNSLMLSFHRKVSLIIIPRTLYTETLNHLLTLPWIQIHAVFRNQFDILSSSTELMIFHQYIWFLIL